MMGFLSTHYLRDPGTGSIDATVRRRCSTFRPNIQLHWGEKYEYPKSLMITMEGDFFAYR